ncbi:DUF6479 family protein [Streptomyces sp. NPDC051771]|uniref:DUF6479 family protein n=1 Tax=Streptomyces sp. NPDC051771 TaxID=3154847 RepID=UPI00343AB5D6
MSGFEASLESASAFVSRKEWINDAADSRSVTRATRRNSEVHLMRVDLLEGPTLAAGVWQSGLAQVLGGLVVVAILIGAFVFGMRVNNKELPPPDPESQPHRPESDRLPGEMTEYRKPSDVPLTDGEHRLMPYNLTNTGEPAPEPPSEEERKWRGISSGGFGSGGTGHGD